MCYTLNVVRLNIMSWVDTVVMGSHYYAKLLWRDDEQRHEHELEYILNEGNKDVVLCERGIRTFEKSTRNILDLNSLALIRETSHLPIIADPSHAAGRYDLVAPLGYAALATGADGLIVEVHHKPDEAMSDGKQSLTLDNFEEMMDKLKKMRLLNGDD